MAILKNIILITILLLLFYVIPTFANESIEILINRADSGEVEAQTCLAALYFDRKDFKRAAKFFEKAALQGDFNGQRNLGFMYYDGKGIPKNDIMAYAYFNVVATTYGEKLAVIYRDILQKKMTPVQIKEAQKISRELFKKIEDNQNKAKNTKK